MFKSLSLFGKDSSAIIGVDWLQLYCKINFDFMDQKSKYTLKLEEFQTRQFKKVVSIYEKNDHIATIVYEPHSKMLAADGSVIKIENKYLYQANLKAWIEELLKDLQLTLLNVTRIDYYIDFNKFKSGVKPGEFIQQFIEGKVCKTGKSKFQLVGSVKKVFTYDYLKFGQKSSDICYYLYNKSKELDEQKNKPWIRESWKNVLEKDSTTWRLEFSLKGGCKELISLDTGESVTNLKSLEVLSTATIKKFLSLLLSKYWSFATKENFEKDKCISRVKKIEFFNLDICKYIYTRITEKKPSNRMDKVFIKKLLGLKKDYGEKFIYFNDNIDTIAHYFARTRDLHYLIT
jgi:hypothetical protein